MLVNSRKKLFKVVDDLCEGFWIPRSFDFDFGLIFIKSGNNKMKN